MESAKTVVCEKCGKKLCEITHEGIIHFRFGKESGRYSPVDIKIYGSAHIRCFRHSCKHWNLVTVEKQEKE